MVHSQLVVLNPLAQFLEAHAFVPELGGLVHNQTIAGCGGQGVHHFNLSVGIALLQNAGGVHGAVAGSAQAAGQAYMQNVLAGLQKWSEIIHIFGNVDLAGAGVRAILHHLIKLVIGDGLAQVVLVFLSVNEKMEGNVFNVQALQMVGADITGGAAAENVRVHRESAPFGGCAFMVADCP